MPALGIMFPDIFAALVRSQGRRESPNANRDEFERFVATFLDQALGGKPVSVALDALREDGLLDPVSIAETDRAELMDTVRSCGVKLPEKTLGTLQKLGHWLLERQRAGMDPWTSSSTEQLREELLGLNGVGPTMADSLLLFAFQRPAYPVDRATYRILVRHGWLDGSSDYDEARSIVEALAPDDPRTLSQISHWFDELGKSHCRASVAKCERCPLKPFLPDGGPIDPFA